MFDIPERDPWPGNPNPDKWAWRDAHSDNLLKRAMLRYPKSIDEKTEENGWIFLREGDAYIGIKPLKSYYKQTNLSGVQEKFRKHISTFSLGFLQGKKEYKLALKKDYPSYRSNFYYLCF